MHFCYATCTLELFTGGLVKKTSHLIPVTWHNCDTVSGICVIPWRIWGWMGQIVSLNRNCSVSDHVLLMRIIARCQIQQQIGSVSRQSHCLQWINELRHCRECAFTHFSRRASHSLAHCPCEIRFSAVLVITLSMKTSKTTGYYYRGRKCLEIHYWISPKLMYW